MKDIMPSSAGGFGSMLHELKHSFLCSEPYGLVPFSLIANP